MTSNTQAGTQHAAGGRVLELPRCALVVLSGPQKGLERIVEGDRVRIGKSSENEFVLDDDTVSRLHCELVRDRRGLEEA